MNATNANPEGAGTEARLPDVEITSAFWRRYIDLVIDKVLPYQWSVLNGEREVQYCCWIGGNPVDAYDKLNHSIRNLRVAAGEEDAPFRGMPFQDSDVYKWLEAVAYALHHRSDPELRRLADGVVDLSLAPSVRTATWTRSSKSRSMIASSSASNSRMSCM